MISRTVRRRVKKCLLWMEVLFILILGAAVGVVAGAFYQISKVLPPQSYINRYKTPAGTTIWSSDHVLLARLANENREPVTIDHIPAVMQHAMVDIEDSRFYQHSGLDFRGALRALWTDLHGRDLTQQGGSTITQQLARNIYLSPTRTLSRKVKELLLAVQIERNWSKQQILETYLNQVYFGSGAYGVQSAARIYFGKDVKDLSLTQAATLAGLPQRPSRLSPYVALEKDGNFDVTVRRRNEVLQRMADMGHISKAQAEAAMREPLKLAHRKPPQLGGYYHAKYFVDYVVTTLKQTYGDDMLFKGGLNVTTTLNYKLQRAAERAAREGVQARGRAYRFGECALVSLDPQTGYIRAMVGGVHEPWEKYQFNCAEQARRSPGSAFKAFVYATALERGWSPYRTISTYARPIKDGNKIWQAHNDDGSTSAGTLPLVSAFAGSVNTAAVNLNMQIGPQNVVEMAHRLGIKSRLNAVPSLALGTSEVSVLEMAGAYAVFADNGNKPEPQAILKITNQDGTLIEANPPRITREVLSDDVVKGMNVLTRAVVTSGTGRAAVGIPDAHGKTGTAESFKDAWFVGFTPELVTAVWCGNRDNTPMRHAFGGTLCAPVWAAYMRQALPIYEKVRRAPSLEPDRPRPMVARAGGDGGGTTDGQSTSLAQQVGSENTLRVRICADSGMLATPYCPHVVSREYLSGQQPAQRCTLHKKPAEAPHAKPRRDQLAHSDQGDNGDDATPHRRRRHRRPPPTEIDQPALETNGPDSAGDDSGTSGATDEARPRRHRRHHTPAPTPDGDNGGDGGNGGTGTDQQ